MANAYNKRVECFEFQFTKYSVKDNKTANTPIQVESLTWYSTITFYIIVRDLHTFWYNDLFALLQQTANCTFKIKYNDLEKSI